MTVQEFINILNKLDPNKNIFLWDKDDFWSDEIKVIDKEIFYVVDAD